MLTPREFQVTIKILTAKVNLFIKDLALEHKVSSRTIHYDLENVKAFLKKNEIILLSAAGKGIWIECPANQRDAALQALYQIQKGELYFDQQMRIQRILLLLLFDNGFITANSFAEKLNVSRGTILRDMDQAAVLLEESGLQLIRRTRYGYQLAGTEIAFRTLAESLLQNGMSVYDIYTIISQLKSGQPSNSCPLPLSGKAAIDYQTVEQVMIQTFQQHPEQLQNENVIVLLTRALVSLVRVSLGQLIGSSTTYQKDTVDYLYPYLELLYLQSELPVLQDELDYIRGLYQQKSLPMDINNLCTDLIKTVSYLEEFPYDQDDTLYSRLLTHLRLDFSGDKKEITKNPFHDLILTNHASLYKSIKTVCDKHVSQSYLFSNECFISYLALHFLTSQHILGVGRKMRVVFVCATGQGATRIIERMLETEIRRIEIVQHCSLVKVDEVIEALEPDFIISVFPIEATIPVIVVEPLPTKANIEAIHQLITEQTDEDELLYYHQPMDFHPARDNPEEAVREVILTGLNIYAKLREAETFIIRSELEFAFLAHVMLLAERYVMNKQLTSDNNAKMPLETILKKVLAEINIYPTMDEIRALCYYLTPIKLDG